MPRGDDAEAALHDLADKFGRGVGNAEELIEANLAAMPDGVRRVEPLPINDEETNKLLDAGVEKLPAPDGCVVVSAAVRGDVIVTVYASPDGRYHYGALELGSQDTIPDKPRPPREKASRSKK